MLVLTDQELEALKAKVAEKEAQARSKAEVRKKEQEERIAVLDAMKAKLKEQLAGFM